MMMPKIKPDRLLNNLINELVWANYITPKTIDKDKFKEIETVAPRIVVTLGNVALRAVLQQNKATIGQFHMGRCFMNMKEL